MTNFYKRITGSEIQGDGSTVVQPAGTITVDSNTNTLKLHDGSTPGGNPIGGGSSLGGFTTYYNSLYTADYGDAYFATFWDSGPGASYLKLPSDANSIGNAVVLSNQLENSAGVSIISSNPRNGNTEYVWNFGSNGELSLPTGGNIGATKGGTMLDGGFGYGTSVTSYYPSGMYSSCVTANPDGTLSISTYGDGTGSSGQWIFGSNIVTIPGTIVTPYGNIESGGIGPGITLMANIDAGQYFNGLFFGNTSNREQTYMYVESDKAVVGVTNATTNQNHEWTFGGDGSLSTINPLIINVNGAPTGVANWNGAGGWNQGYYDNLATTGGTGTGLTVNVAANGGGYINITAITIHTPGTGYTNGDVITINNENNIPGTFNITVPIYNWAFGTDGSLTVPGSGGIWSIGAGTVGITANIANTGDSYLGLASGTPTLFGSNSVQIGTTGHSWNFTTTGNIAFPDLTEQSTAFNETTLAEILSGNVTIGNLVVNGNSAIINTVSYSVEDNIIQIADYNPADTLDIGFVGHRTVNGQLEHTGLVRNASIGRWELFSHVIPQPGTTVDFTGATLDDLQLDKLYANTIHLSGTPPANNYGAAGDLAGDIYIDSNYVYYCTADYVDQYYSATSNTLYTMDGVWHIDKGSYPQPQAGWTITGTSYPNTGGYTTTITGVTDEGATWGITGAGIANNGVIAAQAVTFYNSTHPAIWKTIPITAFNTPAYADSNVAAYLSAHIPTGTYSNANVASYLVAGVSGNVKTSANVIASNYLFANGVNILSTVGGSTYGNANVASYLTAGINTPVNFGNSIQVKDVRDTVYDLGTTGGTIAPNGANGDVQTITLSSNLTLNGFTNPVSGQSITILITQPATGGPYTLTSSMKFANANKILSTAANAVDMLTISYIGSTYYASLITGFA